MVADTFSPVITDMDEKPFSWRGYRPCFNCFLLNVERPNKINQWLSQLNIRSYAHLLWNAVFLKTSTKHFFRYVSWH